MERSLSLKTKQGLVIAEMLTDVTTTTTLNPCSGKLCSSASLVGGKEQQNLFLCFKTGFFFSVWTQLWSKISPSYPSLYFLHPTSHPSLGHVHPVACWQCFFPFRFFFPPLWIHALQVVWGSVVVMDATLPWALPWLERQQFFLTEATASQGKLNSVTHCRMIWVRMWPAILQFCLF